jgi:hypothetical protein
LNLPLIPLLQCSEKNNDEDAYLRHAGSLALARIGKADPIAALSSIHPALCGWQRWWRLED